MNATNCVPRRVEPHVKAKIGESWHSHGANKHGGVLQPQAESCNSGDARERDDPFS